MKISKVMSVFCPKRMDKLRDLMTWHLCYEQGLRPPRYPMPAIPLAVKYDYIGCVNIDDVSNPDDPVIVWMYDSWTGFNPVPALR